MSMSCGRTAHDVTTIAEWGMVRKQHTYEQVKIVAQEGEKAAEQYEQLDALMQIHKLGWCAVLLTARLHRQTQLWVPSHP